MILGRNIILFSYFFCVSQILAIEDFSAFPEQDTSVGYSEFKHLPHTQEMCAAADRRWFNFGQRTFCKRLQEHFTKTKRDVDIITADEAVQKREEIGNELLRGLPLFSSEYNTGKAHDEIDLKFSQIQPKFRNLEYLLVSPDKLKDGTIIKTSSGIPNEEKQ